jgi:bifunctional non-homologous end joining protein LigD
VTIPTFDPMLATTDAAWPKEPVIEPKFDGVRSIITLHAEGTASIRSRNGKDVTSAYPELHARPPSMEGRGGVFDGEVIADDDAGRCSFQLLQRRTNVKNRRLRLVAQHRCTALSSMCSGSTEQRQPAPLAHRRALLENLIPIPAGAWQVTNRLPGPVTDELFQVARDAGLEGLILKATDRIGPAYEPKIGSTSSFVDPGLSSSVAGRPTAAPWLSKLFTTANSVTSDRSASPCAERGQSSSTHS